MLCLDITLSRRVLFQFVKYQITITKKSEKDLTIQKKIDLNEERRSENRLRIKKEK